MKLAVIALLFALHLSALGNTETQDEVIQEIAVIEQTTITSTSTTVQGNLKPQLPISCKASSAFPGDDFSCENLYDDSNSMCQDNSLSCKDATLEFTFADAIYFSDNQPGAGRLSITCGIWGGEESSFTGTSSIVEIDVQLKIQGDATLEFDGSELFRDDNNDPIVILDAIDGFVQNL